MQIQPDARLDSRPLRTEPHVCSVKYLFMAHKTKRGDYHTKSITAKGRVQREGYRDDDVEEIARKLKLTGDRFDKRIS